jgi:hypothetical protein
MQPFSPWRDQLEAYHSTVVGSRHSTKIESKQGIPTSNHNWMIVAIIVIIRILYIYSQYTKQLPISFIYTLVCLFIKMLTPALLVVLLMGCYRTSVTFLCSRDDVFNFYSSLMLEELFLTGEPSSRPTPI